MLYLAETQKKSGFIGSGKTEFKLLACQRSEHEWSSVPGEEVVAAPDDAGYASGVLVIVELNSNRQVQRHQEASIKLVSILQNFSSLSKKFRSQGEEIEQWKESLTYQSEALNRREMEIESRQEQVEQAESDLAQVETQRQEIETQKAEVEQLQEALTRKNAELEGAWAHLNGEVQRFEERQAEAQGGLNDEQAAQIRAVLTELEQEEQHITATISDPAAQAASQVEQWQVQLQDYQQIFNQKRAEFSEQEAVLNSHASTLTEVARSLSEAEVALQATHTRLREQQTLLCAKQEQNQLLTEQLQNQTTLHQRVYALLNATDKVRLSKKVDVTALEAMPEAELKALVSKLESDLDKLVHFVKDQEEELKLQQADIDALQAKLEGASEYDRLQIETEISEEKDRHVMLNRTLVGQRRNLLEREEVLSQHRAVLLRRQGLAPEAAGAAGAELEPVLDEIDELRAALDVQIQQVEAESAQVQSDIDALKQTRSEQQSTVEAQRQALQEAQENYRSQQKAAGELQGQVSLYQNLLPEVEEHLRALSEKLQTVSAGAHQMRMAETQRQAAIAQVQQTMSSLIELAPALV